jgi:hypothetical protein
MAAIGQVLVPTLSGYYWMAGLGDAVGPAADKRVPEMPTELVAPADLNLEQGAASMRAARDAGVNNWCCSSASRSPAGALEPDVGAA